MIECPRPECHGLYNYRVHVEYDVNAVTVDWLERTCECELTPHEWAEMDDLAILNDADNAGPGYDE
jgi:hypothetical protein